MSTIASPRGSISVRSPSSTRASLDSIRAAPSNARRNRSALRDYYGLNNAPKDADANISEESSRTELDPDDQETLGELDAADFNADAYVEKLLAKEGLKGVLKVEADLVSQIRNLDSDRKSLVYDNYAKLLSATSTIRRMRGNMDPLAPTTHTLGPAISHIAETAASLSSSMQSMQPKPQGLGISVRVEPDIAESNAAKEKQRQRDTVRWVLATPHRLHELINEDRDEDAEKDWEEVSRILDQWSNVPGVDKLRDECEAIMTIESDSD